MIEPDASTDDAGGDEAGADNELDAAELGAAERVADPPPDPVESVAGPELPHAGGIVPIFSVKGLFAS